MAPNFQIRPTGVTNFDTDARTLLRMAHDGDTPLTDKECDEILAKNARRAEEQEKAWRNKPILPPTGSDEYKIIKKEIPYGGTNGNPVTEGIQNIITVQVYHDSDVYTRVNFYNKEELNNYISQLQQFADHLN
jgi:hypothetical protein